MQVLPIVMYHISKLGLSRVVRSGEPMNSITYHFEADEIEIYMSDPC